MRFLTAPLALLHASLLAGKIRGSYSLREKPKISRQNEILEGSGGFFVSHAGFVDEQDWCLSSARNGVKSGAHVGLDLCLFDEAPREQLFLLDEGGRIHSKVDPLQCFFVAAKEINRGHSRLKFHECDEVVNFGTFIHNGETSTIQVEDEPDVCIKQNGPRPQRTDAMRAYSCDQDEDAGFLFDYRDLDEDIGGGSELPDDCDIGFGEDCCSDNNCPAGFICQDRICLTEVLALTTINGEDAFRDFNDYDELFAFLENNQYEAWCLARVGRTGQDVAFEICDADDFEFEPNLEWRLDAVGRFHSDEDISRCLTIGEADANGITDMIVGSCDSIHSIFDTGSTDPNLRFLYDAKYCVTRDEASIEGRVTATDCEDASILFLEPI